MRIGVIGINHKLANLELRELFAKACQRCFVSGGLSYQTHNAILLTTCNRTEIYFSSPDLPNSHSYLLQLLRAEVQKEFDQKIYSYFGPDCFQHLARVTAGLDSAIVAETEIQGQVKTAYETAANCIRFPSELHYLFQKSLKIGKEIRAQLNFEKGLPDLEHAIFHVGKHLFQAPTHSRILFIGASDVNCKIINFLKVKNCRNITLCNRSAHKAQQLAQQHQLSTLDWSCVGQWPQYDWVIFGTKAPHYLATQQSLSVPLHQKKLLMDLSVPRNVEPKLGRHPYITLLNIDQINKILKGRKLHLFRSLQQAEQLIDTAVKGYVKRFQVRSFTEIVKIAQN